MPQFYPGMHDMCKYPLPESPLLEIPFTLLGSLQPILAHILVSQSPSYTQRFDEELGKMVELQCGGAKACMSASRRLQHANKEDTLRQIIHRETRLFQSSGFGMYTLWRPFWCTAS